MKKFSFNCLIAGLLFFAAMSGVSLATTIQYSIESQIDPSISFLLNIDFDSNGIYTKNGANHAFTDFTPSGCGFTLGVPCYDYFYAELVDSPLIHNNSLPPEFPEYYFGSDFDGVASGMEYHDGGGGFIHTFLAVGSAQNLLYLMTSGGGVSSIEVGHHFEYGGWAGRHADELFLTVTSKKELHQVPVPEPGAMLMFLVGIVGMATIRIGRVDSQIILTRIRGIFLE